MDEPTVLAKSQEYDGEVKKDTSSDSAHSKDGIKEKDGTVFTELPVYADEEGQQGEIHLDTAADIVTQVIDLDDDPNMNPWTFRMFFLGILQSPNAYMHYL